MKNRDQLVSNLEAKLKELSERLSAVRRDLSDSHSADSEERATESENDATLEEIGMQSQEELELVKRALEKVRAGTYNQCDRCGGEIGVARLSALPYATTCVDCAPD